MGKIYNFFSGINNKHDTGIKKEEYEKDKKMGFAFFFKLLRRSFRKLTGLNLIFILCNIPILFVLFGISGNLNETMNTPANPLFAQLYGVMQYQQSPLTAALNGIVGISTEIQIISLASKIFIYSGLLLIFTLGLSSTGMFYVLRNIVRSEYVSVWNDFFGAIKKNFKQAFIVSILDALIIFFLAYDFVAYKANATNYLMNVFYYSIILISFIYFIMRYYIYTSIVTFNLPLRKIFKNAFLLSILGFKRNFVILALSAIIIISSFYIYILFPTVGFMLPFIFTISLLAYIGIYCSYPVIRKYMIEPYYAEHPDELPEESEEEPIFKDMG